METSVTFKNATAVEVISSHSYKALFISQYSNGSGAWSFSVISLGQSEQEIRIKASCGNLKTLTSSAAHGGFVASVMMTVAKIHFDTTLRRQNQPHLLLFQLQYLLPVAIAQATLHIRDIKLGRLNSLIHISLMQGGRERALAYITFTNMTNDNNAISYPTKAHKALGFRDIPPQISTPGRPSNAEADWVSRWIAADAYSQTTTNVKFLLRRDIKPLCDEVEEWITFVDQRDKSTTESLGYVADMWPQIVDSFVNGSPYSAAGMVAGSLKVRAPRRIELDEASAKRWVRHWYPTLSMNLQVHKALPPGGVDWLWQKVWATEIGNGRMDIQVIIADTEGVVAIGYLSVMIVEQTRNQRAASDRRKSKM